MGYFKKSMINLEKLPKYMFIVSICILMFSYGYFVHKNYVFPYTFLQNAYAGKNAILSFSVGSNINESIYENVWYYKKTNFTNKIPTYDESNAYNGLSLITSIVGNNSLSVRVIDMVGLIIHEWNVDWFDIWPDATHIPKVDIPKSRPGTQIHGVLLLDNGDLIFNYSKLGLVRFDICGNVIWKLPYRTHHSIYLDEYNNLWVSGVKYHKNYIPNFPNYKPLFNEPIVLKVSLDGKILNEISILDLLKQNDLQGLLYMSSLDNWSTEVSGDVLHLNDVESFPSYMKEGIFDSGDIMISLRNINTIVIFSEKTKKVKYVSTGGFVRQHDPDFIDGNTISLFDNNNITPNDQGKSRILKKSFIDNSFSIYYQGNEDFPFYSDILGKHQWLQNGNLLITEGSKGRAFEIDKNGTVVWEYINLVKDGYIGIMQEAQRLPNYFTNEYFNQNMQRCNDSKRNN